jgi:XRE family aerobic/anaerobic benzoate catabolism transcriptional regulator
MQGHAEAMADLQRILDAREPLYRRADATIDTSGESSEQSLARLRQTLQGRDADPTTRR